MSVSLGWVLCSGLALIFGGALGFKVGVRHGQENAQRSVLNMLWALSRKRSDAELVQHWQICEAVNRSLDTLEIILDLTDMDEDYRECAYDSLRRIERAIARRFVSRIAPQKSIGKAA